MFFFSDHHRPAAAAISRLHVVSEDAEGHRSALGVQLLPEDTTKLPRLWREKWRKTRGDLDETMDVLFSTKFSS